MALLFYAHPGYNRLNTHTQKSVVIVFIHGNQPPFLNVVDKMDRGKRFYTTPENNKYPSITTVLGDEPKPWLDSWKAALGKDKAAAETKRCADRGTALHKMVEDYLNNVPDPTEGHDRANIGLFNQIRMKLTKQVGEIRAQEIPLYSDALRVAGRVDCVAEYDGVLSIIDFKTSNNVKTEDMIQDYFLQCTAYAVMFYEMYGVPIDNIVVIIAVEKGLMPMVFKREIFDYLKPLQQRVAHYHAQRENK